MAETIAAGEFKNRCLEILDEVNETGAGIVITKRGRPVARLMPVTRPEAESRLAGAILHQDDDLFSTGETWEADS